MCEAGGCVLEGVGARCPLRKLEPVQGAPRSGAGAAHGVPGAAQQGAGGRPGEEQHAGQEQSGADDDRAGLPHDPGEAAAEERADGAALVASERDHQPDAGDHEAGAERLEVDERAADEHQPAHADEHERQHVGGAADRVLQPLRDLRADDAPVPAEPEHGREEEADRGHPEPPQLGMVVRSGLLRRPLPDAGRRARPQGPLGGLLPGRRHGLAASAATSVFLRSCRNGGSGSRVEPGQPEPAGGNARADGAEGRHHLARHQPGLVGESRRSRRHQCRPPPGGRRR